MFHKNRVLRELSRWEFSIASPNVHDVLLSTVINSFTASHELHNGGALLVKSVWPVVFSKKGGALGLERVGISLILALLKKNAWRLMFDDYESAFNFSVTALRCAESVTKRAEGSAVLMYLGDAMQDWIAPGVTRLSITPRTIAAALFGEAWCVLMYDSSGPSETFADILEQTRPQFLPGRLRTEPNEIAIEMPHFE
jgi:hypothetical protein